VTLVSGLSLQLSSFLTVQSGIRFHNLSNQYQDLPLRPHCHWTDINTIYSAY